MNRNPMKVKRGRFLVALRTVKTKLFLAIGYSELKERVGQRGRNKGQH